MMIQCSVKTNNANHTKSCTTCQANKNGIKIKNIQKKAIASK